jgi:hypothetical protein
MNTFALDNDTVTAGGQMTGRGHGKELPPVAFRVNIPAMAVRVPRSNPSRADAWRCFPSACLPSVGIAVPTLISANPDMTAAWTKRAVFPDANRWPEPDNHFRMGGHQPKGKAKQRGKNQFSHVLLLRVMKQVRGRLGEAVTTGIQTAPFPWCSAAIR